jgi:N6-adenosine-specific RNA methylase IME4
MLAGEQDNDWPFAPLPRHHFGTIVADPPWSFRSWSDKGKNRAPDALVRQKGLAERHYKTMGLKDIMGLPVGDLAAPQSALFLWTIDCMIPEALEVGKAWGFTYKTVAFTWIKTTADGDGFPIGLGYWTRGNPEQCLLFTRGAPKRQSASVRQLIMAPRREHSRKPDEALDRVETLVRGPYCELFARTERPGWQSWGNEINKFKVAA